MRFNNGRPIFVQIADLLEDEVVAERIRDGDRLPSARELAASLEVNPNTAARALQILADRGVAVAERGTGYYVTPSAATLAITARKERFFSETLAAIFKAMDSLGIGMDEIVSSYERRKQFPDKEPV